MGQRPRVFRSALLLLYATSCAAPGLDTSPEEGPALSASLLQGRAGYAVGTARFELPVDAQRSVPVQLWYPAEEGARAEAEAGRAVLEFEPPGTTARAHLEQLTRTAPSTYTQRVMHAADAPEIAPDGGPFPLVLISHCNDCVRFSYFTLAERLAAHGFVVAAPDHVNNTLYDALEGKTVGVELNRFIEQRRLDLWVLTNTLLEGAAEPLPFGLAGRVDADRIAMVGHSFGALTTGYASTRDPRIKAIAILAMLIAFDDSNLPVVGPELAEKITLEPFSTPAFFLLAEEDAINLVGLSNLIRLNFDVYPTDAWLVSMADAGHYSVFDLCGIHPLYINGCGEGVRTTRFLEPLTYLDIGLATGYTASLVTAYLEQQLLDGDPNAMQAIVDRAPGVLELSQHHP